MMICKPSSEENRTVQYPVWMMRKLRKGDFMEGDLEIRTMGGGGGGMFIPLLSTNKLGGLGPFHASTTDNAVLYNLQEQK